MVFLRPFSQSLNLASQNLLLAAPSVPMHALTEPTTEAKRLQPCTYTYQQVPAQQGTAQFIHTHTGMRTDRWLLKNGKVDGKVK